MIFAFRKFQASLTLNKHGGKKRKKEKRESEWKPEERGEKEKKNGKEMMKDNCLTIGF